MAHIFVKTLGGNTFQITDISDDTTVLQLKENLEKQSQIPIKSQRLIFCGKEVLDHQTIKNVGIQEQSTMHLVETCDDFVASKTNDKTQEKPLWNMNVDEMFGRLSKLLIDNSQKNHDLNADFKRKNQDIKKQLEMFKIQFQKEHDKKTPQINVMHESKRNSDCFCFGH